MTTRALVLSLAAVAITAAQGLQFTDIRMDADSDDDPTSTSSSSSPFTAEAAAALANTPSANATVREWDVSAAAEAQAASGGYVTGNWTTLDTSAYAIKTCAPQTWNVTKQKVNSLWLRFNYIAAAGDQVIVSALDGSAPQSFDDSPSGVTTSPINGKALKIEFKPSANKKSGCATTGVVPTMKLDAVGFQWSKEMLVTKENICGAKDTMKNTICAATGTDLEKTMYAKSKAVVRTERTREDGALVTCTAWLWGNKGHMISNNHCFSSQAMVDTTKFQFLVETPTCDGKCNPGACPVAQTLAGAGNVQFVKSDENLDYAVLKITANAQDFVGKYGYLKVRFGAPTKGEEIYIPQHPYGGPKKIAMTDDDADKVAATIKDTNYLIKMSGQSYPNLVGYAADTAGGSSGSPVLARRDHTVIGLHRIGDCNNAATASNILSAPLLAISSDNDGFVR